MRPRIRRLEPGGLYTGIDLRRGDAAVAEHLLDRPEVRSAVQQVGRERVAQRVRMGPALQRGALGPAPHTALYVSRRQPLAGLREEQRDLRAIGLQRGTRPFHVAGQGPDGGLPDRHDPRLAALALDAHLLAAEVTRPAVAGG